MLNNFPARRHVFERFGYIFAKLAQTGATAFLAGPRRVMDMTLAREVVGKRTPCWFLCLFTRPNVGRLDCSFCFVLRRAGLQFGKLQFELVKKLRAALGCRTEAVALHLCDCKLEVRDLRIAILNLCFRSSSCGGFPNKHRLEGNNVVGKLSRIECHVRHCNCFAPTLARHTDNTSPFVLSGDLRTPRFLWRAPVDAFQQITQLRRRQVHRVTRICGPDEPAALQPFHE